MKSFIFLFIYLVFTTNASPIAKTPTANALKICPWDFWAIYIYNAMNDPIHVNVKSEDDDLGDHTLALNENENWSFCENIWKTTFFYASFNWNGSRTASFGVFDHTTTPHCLKTWNFRKASKCFWLVRDTGFYVGPHLTPFPDGWTKLHDWSLVT
ncbi:plant self-incompatibility S1 [Artemisia annua]|uniref:S-protein homolog n=1 Tax=Artemisia annua TaxID=35608 RepID=A0A2U1LQ11_ARTAN|nr:plant self-incompatibility S1 [Artemisia annua]PWA89441.1 plant self-incompatibility S1 [Artemisia annua]